MALLAAISPAVMATISTLTNQRLKEPFATLTFEN
jgi:hypothetical protein